MIVYPGIETDNKEELLSRIALFEGKVDGFHIDIADGAFVSATTLSLEEIGMLPKGFFEAHLMVDHPHAYFELCAEVGFSRVLVHIDALPEENYGAALDLQNWAHELGMEFGIVFQRGIDIVLDECLRSFDYSQVMTVDLGFSGQPFQEDQLAQINKLRTYCPLLPIGVDGHVTNETAPIVKKQGATHLVSTSFLSGENAVERYNQLKGI